MVYTIGTRVSFKDEHNETIHGKIADRTLDTKNESSVKYKIRTYPINPDKFVWLLGNEFEVER